MATRENIIFTSTDSTLRKRNERAVQAGELVFLGHGVYAPTRSDIGDALAQSWLRVLRHLTDDGHISHSSALTMNPYESDWHVAGPQANNRMVALGPKRVLVMSSALMFPETRPMEYLGESYPVSTLECALLEVSEQRRGLYRSAVLRQEALEDAIVPRVKQIDIEKLREIADRNDVDPARLVATIDAIRTGNHTILVSARAKALLDSDRADPKRVDLFILLAEGLSSQSGAGIAGRPWSSEDADQVRNAAFIAAYFSNYIEGTRFPPEEAASIVFRGAPIGHVPDRRTISGTYAAYMQAISGELGIPHKDADGGDFITYLKQVHVGIAGGNQELGPGLFKTAANMAGGYRFVDPERVEATLIAGWEASKAIASKFHRALYLGFVASEVHPFADRNGRASRLVADAHLLAAGYSMMVVTTRSRDFYLRIQSRTSIMNNDEGDWRIVFARGMEKMYSTYLDLPLRTEADAVAFCVKENLERQGTANSIADLLSITSAEPEKA